MLESLYIAAITASTLSASIAFFLFPLHFISLFPMYRKSLKLCFTAILCRLSSQTTVALTLVFFPSFNFF